MPGRPHLTAEDVVDLLDSDREDGEDLEGDDLLEDVDFDEIICPGSDDDLGFEEEVIGNSSDEEQESESDSESESETAR